MTGKNTRTIYQLWADGCSLNGWRFRMKSKAIFARREDAEAYAAEFRAQCVDDKYFECAQDDETLTIKVVEFDFHE